MPDTGKAKVFISWSGDFAKEVAVALREWMPDLFDNVLPWASDTDIEAGARSLEDIHGQLKDADVGIVVVTKQNQHAAWLNYEAGALAKTVTPMKARVIPLLVDIDSPSQLTGPIAQFQAKKFSRDGLEDIAKTLAHLVNVENSTVKRRMDMMWPTLDAKVGEIKSKYANVSTSTPARSQIDMLEEILGHVRVLRENPSSRAIPPATLARHFLTSELQSRDLDAKVIRGKTKSGKAAFILEAPYEIWSSGPSDDIEALASEANARFDIPVIARMEDAPEEPPF